jgi:mono/diheme cytochrome c family protein
MKFLGFKMSARMKVSGGPICAVAVAILLMAGGPADADPLAGKRLSERWCAACHAIAPNQSSANPKAPAFSELAAEPSITEYSLRAFLRTPHSTMPNFLLKPDDADDVISYIMSIKPRP